MYQAKIICDSISPVGVRITTFELVYPRFIHGEFMTHRVFSRNAASSRAIPVKTFLKQVLFNRVDPLHWGANQAGMQASTELTGVKRFLAKKLWAASAVSAVCTAYLMSKVGLHKQVANRILEPFQWMRTVVTATEWDGFFELRCHKDAQPEIQHLALMMRQAMEVSKPVKRKYHLPYVNMSPKSYEHYRELAKISAARCARTSYVKFDGSIPTDKDDLGLYAKLIEAKPAHASPVEHQACYANTRSLRSGNFVGWNQYRKVLGV